MGLNIRCSRGAVAIGIASLLLVVAAMMPGGFGHALAQTAGEDPGDPGPGTSTGGGGTSGGDTQTSTSTSEGQTTTTTSGGASSSTTSDGTTNTTVNNTNTDNTVTVTQGGTTVGITIPTGSVPAGTTMTIDPLNTADVPGALDVPPGNDVPGVTFSIDLSTVTPVGGEVAPRAENFAAAPGTILGFKAFELNLRASSGTEIQSARPVTIEWVVPAQALAAAGGNNQNILLLFFNPATGRWDADAADFMAGNTASFTATHFSTYAFAIRVAGVVTTPAPPTAATPGIVPPVGANPAVPVGTAGTGAGASAPPGAVIPRPANTGTGIPALDQPAVLPIALVVLGLGVLGGVGLRTVRRRA